MNHLDALRSVSPPQDSVQRAVSAAEIERFGRIEALDQDGERWFRYSDVCAALRIPIPRARAYVKRRISVYEFHLGYRSTRIAYIDAASVEALVIRYARAPRAEIMQTLP